jgi:Calx-beta domain-containing protein
MHVRAVVVAALGLIVCSSGSAGLAWAGQAGAAAPTISSLPDQTVLKGAVMGPILFTVGDDVTPADQLILTVSSSNATLLPNENVVLGGSGATRTLTAQTLGQAPNFGLSGTTVLTVTVSDGTRTVSESLTLNILDRLSYVLAEGATGPFFNTDILVANPHGAAPLFATLKFLKDDGTTVLHDQNLGLHARVTVPVDEIPGMEATSFSTVMETFAELAVERTMRWNDTGYGSHTEKASVGPASQWFFAEGAQGFFFTYFLLVNPQTTPNIAHITYFREGLPPIVRDYPLAASSRRTVFAGDDQELVDTSFGARVDFDQPGMAERAMYFGTTPLFTGGHESSGVTKPSREWFLAEGATGTFFTTFVLLANPGDQPADVTLTYLPDAGAPIVKNVTVAAGQRMTRNIAFEDPALANAAAGVRVQSTRPIVVERSQYWPNSPAEWYEAHNSFGVTETSYKWALAEGGTGGANGEQTYILLANPGTDPVDVTMEFLQEQGATGAKNKTFTVPPTSRRNVAIFGPTSDVPELVNEKFSTMINATGPIVVERSFYASPDGRTFSAGTNATATKFRAPLPIAKIGPDQVNVPVGATVTLGVDSLAAVPPTHQWTLLSKPAGSAAALSNPAALRPTFVADVAGEYVAQLVVSLAGTTIRSAPETVLITTARPPIDVAVTAPDNTASEATLDTATFTFTRTGGDPAQPVTILYTLGEPLGITIPGLDFVSAGLPFYFPVRVPETAMEIKQVTIPANQTTASLTIVPLKDNFVESAEPLHATLISKRDYFITTGTATISIADDPAVVEVVASDNVASETGPDTGTFTFTRTGGNLQSTLPVRVELSGTAFHGPDYQLVDTTIVFQPGQTTATMTITPIADGTAEGPETVILTLSAGDPNFTPGAAATATITIND